MAWRISEEGFLQNSNLLSDLKLRLSYGETGNAFGFGAYTAKQLFSAQGTYYNSGVFATAIGVTQGSNPDMKWEVTGTSNIGLDFGLFKNKLTGTLDVYEKTTTNMIFGYSVSKTIVPGGFVWGNGGKIRNRGVELSLSATPVTAKKSVERPEDVFYLGKIATLKYFFEYELPKTEGLMVRLKSKTKVTTTLNEDYLD